VSLRATKSLLFHPKQVKHLEHFLTPKTPKKPLKRPILHPKNNHFNPKNSQNNPQKRQKTVDFDCFLIIFHQKL